LPKNWLEPHTPFPPAACLCSAERYPADGDRAAAIAKAAQQLVKDRLLLEEDTKLFIPSVN
jgi:hypothetical protein